MKKLYTLAILTLGLVIASSVAYSQYCVPRTSTSWFYNQSASTTGAVQNFSNNTGSAQGVFDFSNTIGCTVKPGSTFTLTTNFYYGVGVWVDWNNDGTFANSGNERIYVHNTNRYSWGNFPITVNVPASAVKGKKLRMRVMSGYYWQMQPCGYSTYTSDVEDYFVFVTYDENAGMDEILSPSAECNGTAGSDVTVRFRNSGVNDIDSLKIGGEIRSKIGGIVTPIPDFTYSGPAVASGNSSAPLTIFNYTSGFKAGDTVCVWTHSPNNIKDSIPDDDTLCFVVLEGMKGKFTVGDTSKGHDFHTLQHALDSLHERGAVCDSVIFCLADTSVRTHKGQFFIRGIRGTSPTSPIIITTIDTNKYMTHVTWDSCSEDYNYGFQVEDVSDVYFNGITFSTTNTKSNGYATTFEFKDADRVYVMNSTITNNLISSTSENYALVRTNDVEGLSFDDVTFVNGSFAILGSSSDDVMISEATFSNQFYRSIDLSAGSDFSLEDSWFRSTSTFTNGTAVMLSEINNSITISYNTILTANQQWPRQGVNMDKCNALNSSTEMVNNVFNLGQPWSGLAYSGFYFTDVVGASLVYNTVAVSGNNASNAAFYSDGGTRNTAFNNIFSAMINGRAVHLPVAASVVSADYNNLYSAGNSVARQGSTEYTSVSAWNMGTGLDKNSKGVNPFYHKIQDNNLHVCNDDLFQAGIPIQGVTEDWDGDARDPQKPCIGADEFAPVSNFSLGSDYGLCDGDTTYLVAGKGLTGEIAIWKDGSGTIIDTSRTIMVTAPGKYDVTLLNACGVNADSIEIIAPAKVSLPGDTNICPGLTYNVDATIVNGNGYQWSSGQSTAQITVMAEGTYHVTTTDMWKCNSTDSIVVTYSNAANLNVKDTIVCQNAPFGLFGGTSTTQPQVSYRWFGFDGAASETGDNVFIDYDFLYGVDDTIVVCELTHRGCVTMDTCKVKRKPAPVITGLTVVVNNQGIYVNSNTSTGENHNWDFGDNNSSQWDKPRYRYSTPGIYNVTYTNSNICGSVDTTFEVAINATGLSEGNDNAKMVVYPNPSNGNFFVNFEGLTANDVSVKVIDATGRTILYKELGQVSGSAIENLVVENGASGVYILQINIDGELKSHRITIE